MNDFDELTYEIAERAGISEDRGWATISVDLLDRILAALKTDGAPIRWRSVRDAPLPDRGDMILWIDGDGFRSGTLAKSTMRPGYIHLVTDNYGASAWFMKDRVLYWCPVTKPEGEDHT